MNILSKDVDTPLYNSFVDWIGGGVYEGSVHRVLEKKAIDPFDAIGNRRIVEKIVADRSEGLMSKANECILQCLVWFVE